MNKSLVVVCTLLVAASSTIARPFKVLAIYRTDVEPDHIHFAQNAIAYFSKLAQKRHFTFDTTTDWGALNDENLKKYKVVLWLNEFPHTKEEKSSFERYMEHGGAWLGFHVSGYNDKYTKWPWFVDFMGGAVFYTNNWPPLPAALIVDTQKHPVTRHLPPKYQAPANEWYMWKPSPRLDPNVQVLVTLDPANYPLGKKNLLTEGDIPVVWTNKKFKMVYMNMGHGDKIFDSPIQIQMFEDTLMWLGR